MCFWKKKRTNDVGSVKPVENQGEKSIEHIEVNLGGEIYKFIDSPPRIPIIGPPRPRPRKFDDTKDKRNWDNW
jgi:hypothetical protein